MARRRRWPAVVGLLTISSVLSGACGSTEIPLEEDGYLLVRAEQAICAGDPIPLREITGGDWDRVYVFAGVTVPEFVEDTVQAQIEHKPEFYTSDRTGILVFVKSGTVQRAVGLRPYPFDGNGGDYGPDVTVQPTPHPDPYWLKLVDKLP